MVTSHPIPLTAVQEALLLRREDIRTIEGREVITLRGATLPLCRVDELFGLEQSGPPSSKSFVVVTGLGARRLGLVVDELFGQKDIIIKALGKSLSDVPGFSGATDLGDQNVALVLDPPALLEEVLKSVETTLALGADT